MSKVKNSEVPENQNVSVPIDRNQAIEVLKKEQEERMQNCLKEINAILEKYQLALVVPGVRFVNGQVLPEISLAPK